MQEDLDNTDADRVHEGYLQRYEKERRASYALATFGLLSFVAVAVAMVMHHNMNTTALLSNIEPASGSTAIESKSVDNPEAQPSKNPDTISPRMVQPDNDNPPQ